MARRWCYSLLLTALAACAPLREGDLLFHVADRGNAITDVTPGMVDHVAIVAGRDSVVEAVGRGVRLTPVDSLRRQQGYYIIGKVREADRRRSVGRARRYVGRPYDSLYVAGNEAIYCSELVQLSYVDRRGRPLFAPIPMSFHDASGRITPYWTQFYGERGMAVPEGQPGTNPGELSQRKCVRLVGRLK